MDEEGKAVGELEPELTARFDAQRGDPQLLFHLAHRARRRRFPMLDVAARAVDLARPQAPLLVDEEDLPIADDEEERCLLLGFPPRPVDVFDPHVLEDILPGPVPGRSKFPPDDDSREVSRGKRDLSRSVRCLGPWWRQGVTGGEGRVPRLLGLPEAADSEPLLYTPDAPGDRGARALGLCLRPSRERGGRACP
ncbi:protein of unknown function [Candidatus Bipolaricaulis anaerobius]|uniref:Uncharacterized protein n=1 Tax=Candidatus Bipolaricaulis anaerobius TaxID=2026885 RepID=A0A2X3K5T2_9BACT|nr:protein of unknown function [Candidatus Bipolaricaulis anaerobius]